MLRSSIVAALFSVLISTLTPLLSFAQSEDRAVRVTVPRTNPAVMVDGIFSDGEWNSAAEIELPWWRTFTFKHRSSLFILRLNSQDRHLEWLTSLLRRRTHRSMTCMPPRSLESDS
jgi:hypothetical protein